MTRARLFLESVRHTRASQLAQRLRLTVRRQIIERTPFFGDRRAMAEAEGMPPLAPSPLQPVFAPRALAEKQADIWHAHLLNEVYSLRHPIAWHDPAYTRLAALTLHYMEYLESVDDESLRAIVQDWIAHCPPYRPRYWLDDWNAYALSIRVVVWMQQWAARRLDPLTRLTDRMSRSLVRQLRFLEENLETDIRGNHILKNAKALLWAGRFFEGREAARWRQSGEAILDREMADQFLEDGMHFERSPAYHLQVVADLVECWAALESGARRERLKELLQRAAQPIADLTHPDGAPSLFNDGAMHMAYAPAVVLDALERVAGVRAVPRAVFAFPDAGYFGARFDDEVVIVDCGAIGASHLPAHAHGDVLAFEWSLGKRRLVVDTGVFEYKAGAKRERSRATIAHNTLTLDDADQAQFWGEFRVGRRPRVKLRAFEGRDDGFTLEGAHDGYAAMHGAPRHVRRFEVTRGAIEVEDRIEGGHGQRARARILLGPGLQVAPEPDGATIEGNGIKLLLASNAPMTVSAAPWWPDFGVEQATLQITLDYGVAPCAGRFALRRSTS